MTPLIDTNVLLDVLESRQPFFPASAAVWSLAERRAMRLLVSAISFNNAFYLLRKSLGANRAWKCVAEVSRVFDVAAVDASVVAQALTLPLADFEDAIQAASAIAAGADVIVTRNAKDFTKAGLVVLSPEEFLLEVAKQLKP